MATRADHENAWRNFGISPSRYAFTFASGRTCLYAVLQALNLSLEDEVLLQTYTCVGSPIPFMGQGEPVYVDCDPKTLTLSLRTCVVKLRLEGPYHSTLWTLLI